MRDRGKAFENKFRSICESYLDISIDRVNDNVTMYKNSKSFCDFMVYQFPFKCYVECKTHKGNIFPFSCIEPVAEMLSENPKKKQKSKVKRLLEKSKIPGVSAGFLIWLEDKNVTMWLDVRDLVEAVKLGYKSIGFHNDRVYSFPEQTSYRSFEVTGKQLQVYTKYDMNNFFRKIGEIYDKEERRTEE